MRITKLRAAGVLAAAVAGLALAGTANATVTTTFANDEYTATATAGEPLAITCSGGNLAVNGAVDGTAAPCAAVRRITLHGSAGPNAFAFTPADGAFPTLRSVLADGQGGLDMLTVNGTAGADDVTVGGTDALLFTASGVISIHAAAPMASVYQGGGGDDAIVVDGGDWLVDGNEGSDAYTVVFGQLGSTSDIEDTGTAGTDRLVYLDDCTATVAAPRISKGSESVTFGGMESAPVCTPEDMPLPPCDATIRQSCVQSFTVDGGTPPAAVSLEARLYSAEQHVTFRVKRSGDDDLIGLGGLTTSSLVRIVLNTGAVAPDQVLVSGSIVSVLTTYDAANGNTARILLRPTPSSLLPACPVGCPDDVAAQSDRGAVLGGALGVAWEQLDQSADDDAFAVAARGFWAASNANFLLQPSWEPTSRSLQIYAFAPRFKQDGTTPNALSGTVFLPKAVLDLLGIEPATATAASFAVAFTGGPPIVPTVTADAQGARLELPIGVLPHTAAPLSIAKAAPAPPPAPAPAPTQAPAPAASGGGGGGEPAAAPAIPTDVVAAALPAPAVEAASEPELQLKATVRRTLDLDRPTLLVAVDASPATTVKATLKRNGKVVATWTRRLDAGSGPLRLSLPLKARKVGSYRLIVSTGAGTHRVTRTLPVRFVR